MIERAFRMQLAPWALAAVIIATPCVTYSAPKAPLLMTAAPIIVGGEIQGTWTELAVRLENVSGTTVRGTLVAFPDEHTPGVNSVTKVRAPVALAAGATAVIKLLVPSEAQYSFSIRIAVQIEGAEDVTGGVTVSRGGTGYSILDLGQPPRLVALRAKTLPTTTAYRGASHSPISVLTVSTDPTSGDLVLPDHPGGYGHTTVIVTKSDILSRLPKSSLDAMLTWVRSGGTLAVAVARPEDLRIGVLPSLAGGDLTPTDVPTEVTHPSQHALQAAPPNEDAYDDTPPTWLPPKVPEVDGGATDSGATGAKPEDSEPSEPDAGTTIPIKAPPTPKPSSSAPATKGLTPPMKTPVVKSSTGGAPSSETLRALVGYRGGNLTPSRFGMTASVGLGQLHVLAFDPSGAPGLTDPWIETRMLELVAGATRTTMALDRPIWTEGLDRHDGIRAELDPNENFRPGLILSTLLLLIYSVLVGPVAFGFLKKRGRLLDPLVAVPILSSGTFMTIVVIGFISKGIRNQSQRLSLVEIASGSSEGVARTYRSFYTARPSSLNVRASAASSTLLTVASDGFGQQRGTLRSERDTLILEGMPAAAWQTIVVREDHAVSLPGMIQVRADSRGNVEVRNNLNAPLRDAIVWLRSGSGVGAVYFASIAPGTVVRTADGKHVTAPLLSHAGMSTRDLWNAAPPNRAGALTHAWDAVFRSSRTSNDVWSGSRRALLIAEIQNGDGVKDDGGYRITENRRYVRVLGEETP